MICASDCSVLVALEQRATHETNCFRMQSPHEAIRNFRSFLQSVVRLIPKVAAAA